MTSIFEQEFIENLDEHWDEAKEELVSEGFLDESVLDMDTSAWSASEWNSLKSFLEQKYPLISTRPKKRSDPFRLLDPSTWQHGDLWWYVGLPFFGLFMFALIIYGTFFGGF